MAGKDETPDQVAKKVFVATLIGTIIYGAVVVIFIL